MSDKIIQELRETRRPLHARCVSKESGAACSKSAHIEGHPGVCVSYWDPSAKWRLGDCPLADPHLRSVQEVKKEKVRVGQQKQKKHS